MSSSAGTEMFGESVIHPQEGWKPPANFLCLVEGVLHGAKLKASFIRDKAIEKDVFFMNPGRAPSSSLLQLNP